MDIQCNPKQVQVWQCDADEILLRGNRGSGKTYTLLWDYAVHWMQYNRRGKYRGLFCRQTYPQLKDAINKARGVFGQFGAKERNGGTEWFFPDGSFFFFSHLDKVADEQGQEYDWIAVDEAGNFPTPEKVYALKATQRNSCNIPVRFFLSANAGGVGRHWIKADYIDPAPDSTVFNKEVRIRDKVFFRRVCSIRMLFDDNYILKAAQPDYLASVASGLTEYMYRAWVLDDWDCMPGGSFSDLWDSSIHVIRPFRIPGTWYVNRSFDWGSSAPYSVGWWAESDGSDFYDANGEAHPTIRGDLFRIAELYGWNGQENKGLQETTEDTSEKILKMDRSLGYHIDDGPADTAIFANNAQKSIADDYAKCGVVWRKANKGPGARVQAVKLLREYLSGSIDRDDKPGIFIFDHCRQFIRTVPMLRSDETNPEDVDTEQEDHIFDETAYRLLSGGRKTIGSGSAKGLLS